MNKVTAVIAMHSISCPLIAVSIHRKNTCRHYWVNESSFRRLAEVVYHRVTHDKAILYPWTVCLGWTAEMK